TGRRLWRIPCLSALNSRSLSPSRSIRCDSKPCRVAFLEDRALPDAVLGPVLFLAFRWLVSRLRSSSTSSTSHTPSRRRRAKLHPPTIAHRLDRSVKDPNQRNAPDFVERPTVKRETLSETGRGDRETS